MVWLDRGIFVFGSSEDAVALSVALVASIANGVMEPVLSLLISRMFQEVSNVAMAPTESNDALSRVSACAAGVFSVGVLCIATNWVSAMSWGYLGAKQSARARRLVFRALIYKDMTWFNTTISVTSLISTAYKQIEDVEKCSSSGVRLFIESCVSIIVSLILVFYRSWALTLVSLAGIPILIGVVGIMGRAVVSRAMKHRYAMGRAAEIMKWTLNSLDTVKLLRGETKQSLKFQAALQDVYACGLCLYNTFNLQVSLGKTILLVAFTAGVYFGAILVEENRITAGAAVFVIYSSLTIAQQLAGLSQNLMTVQRGFGSADALLKICGSSEERHKEFKRSIGMHPRSSRGAVSFFGVDFAYEGRENVVLRNLNMIIEAGQFAVIVGKSGCGKSTIGLLLSRLYEPTSGSIFIDNMSLRSLSAKWILENICVVEQQAVLFDSLSIIDNISLGSQRSRPVSSSRLQQACREFHTTSFVNELAEGWDTGVDRLSGGQKQAVALSRAMMMSHAPIMIFDESISALDPHLRRLCMDSIRKMRQGKTTIFITHDYSCLETSDTIYYMKDGSISLHGTHSHLISRLGSSYNTIFKEHTFPNGQSVACGIVPHSNQSYSPHSNGDSMNFSCSRGISHNSQAIDTGFSELVRALLQLLRDKWLLCFNVLLNSAIGLTTPVMAFLLARMLSNIVSVANSSLLRGIAALLAICLIVGMLEYSKTIIDILCEKWMIRLRQDIFEILVHQHLRLFEEDVFTGRLSHELTFSCNPTKLTNLVVNDIESLRVIVCQFVGTLISAMTVGIVSIIWSLAACWKLALASLGLVAIFCFSSYSIRRVTRTWTVKRQMNLDSIIVHFSTTLEGIRTVKLLGKESYFLFHLDELQKRHLELAFHQMVYFGLSLGVTKGFVVFTQGLLLVYGLYLVAIGQAAAPNVVLVFTLILFCMQNCSQLLSSIPSVGSALTALLEVLWLTKLPLQRNECSEGWTPSRGEIEIRNVKFGYGESHKLIFNNLSLSTDDCEVLSLTGSSGCGKSTLWKLLTRLYEPLEGTITIDGRDITTIPIDDIRAAVSVVNQMPIKFFEGSIYDNLSFALSGTPISKESKMVQIRRAARACGLDEVISRLPTGYDTLISDPNHGQGKLSGGEIQRLGIARALLSNPKILILDEVTSALDTGSAMALKNFIKACKISRNIKIIIITHDVEFASVADKTIIMM